MSTARYSSNYKTVKRKLSGRRLMTMRKGSKFKRRRKAPTCMSSWGITCSVGRWRAAALGGREVRAKWWWGSRLLREISIIRRPIMRRIISGWRSTRPIRGKKYSIKIIKTEAKAKAKAGGTTPNTIDLAQTFSLFRSQIMMMHCFQFRPISHSSNL